ncbi:hypothetical protein [Methylophaga thiooxydans]|uniref:hypothetical protein n=1 Tax=Methylophaga thiooxydans TaxID=392484 RepID=UPI002352E098|nr:hypothetical protein [Methylophaga thiooxydans]
MREESLGVTRLLMVLSSFSPLFLIWAIKGTALISDAVLWTFCLALALIPTLILWQRISTAKKHKDSYTIKIGTSEDHRSHLLVYLFAMLLPFIGTDPESWRELASLLAAFAFVIFIFWHMNLHYMNIWFALFGYRVYTVSAPDDGNKNTGRHKRVLITKRSHLDDDTYVTALRLSNTVYMEVI